MWHRNLLFSFILFNFIALIGSCKTKEIQPTEFGGYQIVFGQGGGFSGLKTEYALLENGHLYKKMYQTDSFELIKKVSPKFVAQQKQNVTFLGLRDLPKYSPGDLYYFIDILDGSNKDSWVWGMPTEKPDKNLVSFYNILFRTAKKEEK